MALLENLKAELANVERLQDILNLAAHNLEDYKKFVMVAQVRNGDPLAFLGEMDDLGTAGAGCNPEYKEVGIVNKMKRWELGDWSMANKMCYKSLEGSIAEFSLKGGTEKAEAVEFMTQVYIPKVVEALNKAVWRWGWFGDKEAKNISDGGQITDGVDTSLFTVADGLFKQIFAACAENADQLTAIEANTKTTYKAQKEAILAEGVATGIVDKVLMDADARISASNGAMLLMTKAMADALAYDLKKLYNHVIHWETLFEGFDVAEYNGVKVARISVWDRFIKAYENDGTKINKPYRIIFTNPSNLMLASDANDLVSEANVYFDERTRENLVYAQGKFGAMLKEDDMVHAAY